MTERKDKSLDDIYNDLKATQARLIGAEEIIKQFGEGAEKVSLSITGACTEISMLMKQLFICSQQDMAPEYELFRKELFKNLRNITLIVDTRFGKMATSTEQSTETH